MNTNTKKTNWILFGKITGIALGILLFIILMNAFFNRFYLQSPITLSVQPILVERQSEIVQVVVTATPEAEPTATPTESVKKK